MTALINIPRLANTAPVVSRQFGICLARVGRLVDLWVAAAIARRARQVTLFSRALPNEPAQFRFWRSAQR